MLEVLLVLANALIANPLVPDRGGLPLDEGSTASTQQDPSGAVNTPRPSEQQGAPTAPIFAGRAYHHQDTHYRALARALPDIAVFLFDHDLRFLVAEGAALETQGYRREAVEGHTLDEVLPPERASALARHYRAILAGENLDFTREVGERSYQVQGRAIRDETGTIVAGLLVSQDVTARRQAEQALQESEARYWALVNHSSDAVLLTAPDGRIIAANPAACRMFRGSEEEICRAGRAGLVVQSDPRLAVLLAERDSTGLASGELTMRRLDGTAFPVDIASVVFQDRNGEKRTSMTIHDITARKQIEDELRASEARLAYLAMHDTLTGLPNRRHLGVVLAEALLRLQRGSTSVALLLLDLDGFKEVNDTWGHEAGDYLLVTIAERLQTTLGPGATAARLGGDEFAVLLDGAAANVATALAAKLETAISAPVRIGPATVAVTASVGVALVASGDTSEDLLRRADAALYTAKRAGGNRHIVAID